MVVPLLLNPFVLRVALFITRSLVAASRSATAEGIACKTAVAFSLIAAKAQRQAAMVLAIKD
jgi:hypothetical protein